MIADAGTPDDYSDGAVHIIEAGGREVGVIRWGDDFYAVRNICPHESGPVCAGLVRPRIFSSGPGELELDVDAPILACPWHGWEFDIRTGKIITGEAQKVRTYPVRVRHGRVQVEVPAAR